MSGSVFAAVRAVLRRSPSIPEGGLEPGLVGLKLPRLNQGKLGESDIPSVIGGLS